MSKNIDPQLLERFFNKRCSADEASRVILWLRNEQNKEEVEKLLQAQWQEGKTSIDTDFNKIYANILEEIANDRIKSSSGSISLSKYSLGIAAVIVLVVVSALTILYLKMPLGFSGEAPRLVVKSTNKGEKLTTKLPDGTVVTLNSESQLSFPEKFNDDVRKVTLTGEAYFSVAKNVHQPFIVKSGPVETMAVGTAFNVKAEPEADLIVVSLAEGKVIVKSTAGNDKKESDYYLLPGDEIQYSGSGKYLTKGTFSYRSTIAWKDGILVFDDDGIDDLKKKIEKWYGVTLVYKDRPDKEWKFTSEYKNERLENVLEGLKYSKNINYVIENDSVEITFNKTKEDL